MSTQTVAAEVTAFVDAVRAQLDDLAPDVVEDLTDGLGADVSESLLEPGGTIPDPAVYAEELRAAADLPPRGTAARTGGDARAVALRFWQGTRALVASREDRRWWPAVREYGAILAPLWWIVRGWTVTILAGRLLNDRWPMLVPNNAAYTTALILVVLLSVEAGRRARSRRWQPLRPSLIALNLLVLAALPVALLCVRTTDVQYVTQIEEQPPGQGLWLEGTEVRNIYPYDSTGRPLEGIQLWTDQHTPLRVGGSASQPIADSQGRYVAQLPAFDGAGQPLWNVFPLRQWVRMNADMTEVTGPSTTELATRPEASLAPLPSPGPAVTPSPTTSPTP